MGLWVVRSWSRRWFWWCVAALGSGAAWGCSVRRLWLAGGGRGHLREIFGDSTAGCCCGWHVSGMRAPNAWAAGGRWAASDTHLRRSRRRQSVWVPESFSESEQAAGLEWIYDGREEKRRCGLMTGGLWVLANSALGSNRRAEIRRRAAWAGKPCNAYIKRTFTSNAPADGSACGSGEGCARERRRGQSREGVMGQPRGVPRCSPCSIGSSSRTHLLSASCGRSRVLVFFSAGRCFGCWVLIFGALPPAASSLPSGAHAYSTAAPPHHSTPPSLPLHHPSPIAHHLSPPPFPFHPQRPGWAKDPVRPGLRMNRIVPRRPASPMPESTRVAELALADNPTRPWFGPAVSGQAFPRSHSLSACRLLRYQTKIIFLPHPLLLFWSWPPFACPPPSDEARPRAGNPRRRMEASESSSLSSSSLVLHCPPHVLRPWPPVQTLPDPSPSLLSPSPFCRSLCPSPFVPTTLSDPFPFPVAHLPICPPASAHMLSLSFPPPHRADGPAPAAPERRCKEAPQAAEHMLLQPSRQSLIGPRPASERPSVTQRA